MTYPHPDDLPPQGIDWEAYLEQLQMEWFDATPDCPTREQEFRLEDGITLK